MQHAATIEGITICNMWLGWQIMTFIKLQILFKTLYSPVRFCTSHVLPCGRCCTNFDYFLHYLRGTLVYYQYFFLSSVSFEVIRKEFFVPAISDQYNTIYYYFKPVTSLTKTTQSLSLTELFLNLLLNSKVCTVQVCLIILRQPTCK